MDPKTQKLGRPGVEKLVEDSVSDDIIGDGLNLKVSMSGSVRVNRFAVMRLAFIEGRGQGAGAWLRVWVADPEQLKHGGIDNLRPRRWKIAKPGDQLREKRKLKTLNYVVVKGTLTRAMSFLREKSLLCIQAKKDFKRVIEDYDSALKGLCEHVKAVVPRASIKPLVTHNKARVDPGVRVTLPNKSQFIFYCNRDKNCFEVAMDKRITVRTVAHLKTLAKALDPNIE